MAKKILSILLAVFILFQANVPAMAITRSDFRSINGNRIYYWPDQCQGSEDASGNCCSVSSTPAPSASAPSTPTNNDYAGRQILTNAQLTAIQQNSPTYQQAASQVGIPWQMLAVVHLRESGLKVANPENKQGIYQFADKHGGPYPGGPVDQAEFLRQTVLAAQFLKSAARSNYEGHKTLSINSDAETIKDTFFSYNGRASVYTAQAVALGFGAKGYEGSPYVMNKADAKRDPTVNKTGWGQIKKDHGPIVYPANQDYGAFVEYGALAGIPTQGGSDSCAERGTVRVYCDTNTNDTSSSTSVSLRQKVVCLAQAELRLWNADLMTPGFRSNSDDSYSKYSQNQDELWCADFVSWIYKQAGYPIGRSDTNWRVSSVKSIKDVGHNKNEKFHYHDIRYTPRPGDIAIHLQGTTSHVNIVTAVEGGKITLIGGDQDNKDFNGSEKEEYPHHAIVSEYSVGTDPKSLSAHDITGFVSPD